MKCPICKSTRIKVLNSKKKEYLSFNIRTLECDACSAVFQTIESIVKGSTNTAVCEILKDHQQDKALNTNSNKLEK